MDYRLIVHMDDVKAVARDSNASAAMRSRAEAALKSIDEILQENNTLRIDAGDPRLLPEVIKPGDHVTLYGARHGACLSAVANELKYLGVKTEYHPKGCI